MLLLYGRHTAEPIEQARLVDGRDLLHQQDGVFQMLIPEHLTVIFGQYNVYRQFQLLQLGTQGNHRDDWRIAVCHIIADDQHWAIAALHRGTVMVTQFCKPDLVLLRCPHGRLPLMRQCFGTRHFLWRNLSRHRGLFLGLSTLIDVFVHMNFPAMRQSPCVAFLSSHRGFTSSVIQKKPPKFKLHGGSKCKKA